MIGMAMGKGADAIVAMRYDSGEQLGFGVSTVNWGEEKVLI